jgi:hypothetical protein
VSERIEVRVDWHSVQFRNCALALPPHGSGVEKTGLVREGLEWPELVPGVWAGPIGVTVESLQGRPDAIDSSWEDIAEFSAIVEDGPLVLCSMWETPAPDWPRLDGFGPGAYRVRVHARGRDISYDGVVSEPSEEYLFVSWLEEATPATPIALGSRTGKSWVRSEEIRPMMSVIDALRAQVSPEPAPVPVPGGPYPPIVVTIRLDPEEDSDATDIR